MDYVRYEIGIEMNNASLDDHVPESERKNKVITERFRIAYYQLPYKKKYQGILFINWR